MPPRKSTSSVTPADPDDSQLSPAAPSTSDKPITATEQQIKARAELGVSVEVRYLLLPVRAVLRYDLGLSSSALVDHSFG